ncbi:MAG: peptidoglycan editing factor PgeF [Alphaproteobacteria bacterium]|nr:peptidoglycan editing factor PgeF [Alphaproteobacteria bacterium]
MITLQTLSRLPHVRHAFFTREGGVSDGLFASLNCGYGSADAPANVAENRARAAARLGLASERLLTLHQIHSTQVLTVNDTNLWRSPGAPQADGLVTATAGIALGVLSADCAPVLLADPEHRVIGAAHAGWRGALAGIVEATVAAMEQLGARRDRIHAAIGPCIARDSYEVGPEFPAKFTAQDPGNAAFFVPARRAGHYMFDLPGYLLRRLHLLGVATAEDSGHDTLSNQRQFFSFRHNTLNGIRDYGRGLSAIALAD